MSVLVNYTSTVMDRSDESAKTTIKVPIPFVVVVGSYQGVLAVEDSIASWHLSSRRMVCELSQAAFQPRVG